MIVVGIKWVLVIYGRICMIISVILDHLSIEDMVWSEKHWLEQLSAHYNFFYTVIPRRSLYAASTGYHLCCFQVTGRIRWVVWCGRSQKCPVKRRQFSSIRGRQMAFPAETLVFATNQWQMARQNRLQEQRCQHNINWVECCVIWSDCGTAAGECDDDDDAFELFVYKFGHRCTA